MPALRKTGGKPTKNQEIGQWKDHKRSVDHEKAQVAQQSR